MNNLLLGENIRAMRIKLGFSQEEAAELCDICEKTYGKLERGQANVTLKVLNKVAGGLGLNPVAIIQGALPEELGVWEYFAVLEPCHVLEADTKFTYGVIACKNTSVGRYIVATVHDVSTDPNLVSDMVDCFNSYMLSPTHLADAIYDILP